MKKTSIKKWCNALRSGKYKQTQMQLQDDNGYCCLGVACREFIPKKKLMLDFGFLYGAFPEDQLYAPGWLKDIDEDFKEITDERLSNLNDNMDLTFDEIADVLEAVYIHEVLK